MTATEATKPGDSSNALRRDLLSVRDDVGSAAREHRQAGFPICSVEDDTPEDLLVREYSDGRPQRVRFDVAGDQVIRDL